jgi:hypothetical protein
MGDHENGQAYFRCLGVGAGGACVIVVSQRYNRILKGNARPDVARAGVWLERMTPHTPAIDAEEEADHAGVMVRVEQQRS